MVLPQLKTRHMGQGIVEYALVLVLVVIVVVVVLYLVGEKMSVTAELLLPIGLRWPA